MRVRQIWDDLRSSLWFRPTGWILAFGLLAFVVLTLDQQMEAGVLREHLPWYFRGGPAGARTILTIIGGGVLTVTTLTFSIIMVAVVQMANAYSPRLLRQYLAESTHQHVLGILIGTFLFSLLVLREVQDSFVPSLSITVAVALSLVAVAAFVFFINYVSHSIGVGQIVSLIMDESEKVMDDLFPESVGEPWPKATAPKLPDGPSATVTAESSGYVTLIEANGLLRAASEAGAVVQLEQTLGDYVFHDMPLARVWPAEAVDEALVRAVRGGFQLGRERTLTQDLLSGIRQLSDVALRALSPGINDPSTAEHCIDALANLLSKLAQRQPVTPYRCDAEGNMRVIACGATFEQVLDAAFGKIRRYAANDLTCTLRLIEASGELGHATEESSERKALWEQVAMVARAADRHMPEPADRALVNERLKFAAAVLEQDVSPVLLDEKVSGEQS